MDNNATAPTVSVIIPCYNCAEWIEKCLTALENQTYRNFEVLCVDDCSTDATYAIIESYKDHSKLNINLLKNEKNSGPAVSRNRAALIAQSEWLAFCDSDDWYDETYLKEMLMTAKRDNSDVVMCEYRKIYSDREPEDVRYLSPIDDASSVEDKLVYSKSSLCLLLLKKELFVSNPIPDLRNGEDIACIPCLEAKAEGISVIKKPLYNYLMRTSSASNKPSEKVYISLLSAFNHIEENFSDAYPQVLEYLGIRTVLYGATINALKADVSISVVQEITEIFLKKYPEWNKNDYISTLSLAKKLYLRLLQLKMYRSCRLLAHIHLKLSI